MFTCTLDARSRVTLCDQHLMWMLIIYTAGESVSGVNFWTRFLI